MNPLALLGLLLRGLFSSRLNLAAENRALRQQLAVLRRTNPRRRLRPADRAFWVVLRRLWAGWRSALVIVSPDTVVRWHRQGFRLYWRWRSRRPGRRRIDAHVRRLIRRLARDNPLWGAPRIRSKLALLGHQLAESTVARYLRRRRRPPSPTWRTFLDNHVAELASIDFLIVPTATFRLLYVLVILRHDRRRVVHFNVTAHASADWVRQQIREAFPFDTAPKYLIRDRDGIYGGDFGVWLKGLGIEEVLIAPRSPWQNPFVERLVGTLRRECLDHVIVLGERHLYCILKRFITYYHEARCHQSLDRNAPVPREVEPPSMGRIVSEPHLGGLHHRYRRAA